VSEVIDHVGIRVSDLPSSRRMYEAALAELGFVVLSGGTFEGDDYVLFGRGESDDFGLHSVGGAPGRDRVTTGAHIAFDARDAEAVDRWYAAALRHGGTDNGTPGLRPEYSGRYYAAFVLDPDGNNVEAVFHTPRTSYGVWPIGRVRSTLDALDEAPRQAHEGAPEAVLEIDPAYADALHGIEPGDELIVLTWLHLAARDVLLVHPRDDVTIPLTGVFKTRSSMRPNPIGLHRVTVVSREGATGLRVEALEAVDGTPIVDLKVALGPR
jgi:tRNA-Thr(GGU) m(6)t(6)A37 methyltransferase TsaA